MNFLNSYCYMSDVFPNVWNAVFNLILGRVQFWVSSCRHWGLWRCELAVPTVSEWHSWHCGTPSLVSEFPVVNSQTVMHLQIASELCYKAKTLILGPGVEPKFCIFNRLPGGDEAGSGATLRDSCQDILFSSFRKGAGVCGGQEILLRTLWNSEVSPQLYPVALSESQRANKFTFFPSASISADCPCGQPQGGLSLLQRV